ncbi:hypothetical protein BDL97_03G053500 [Sphagnum fallax]|nr:hypothetical protein BDL97_03G053500 [Sphagnum fallax]
MMQKGGVERVLTLVRHKTGQVVEALRVTALEFSWDLRDAAHGGFGVPKLISSAASLSVAVVAAAGTAAITLDAAGKVFGKRECNKCNGWEGVRCTMCAGKGSVQYHVSDFGIPEGSRTVQSMAAAIAGGQAKVEHLPPSMNLGLPLPSRECPNCEGTGVMKCAECKGDSWKPKVHFDDVMDVPWKAWDVYRKTEPPPNEIIQQSMADPATAAWLMFGKPELENGIQIDDELKKKLWWNYKEGRVYDEVREKVERRETGWEDMQEVLKEVNPDQAMQDPVIVRNVPYFKAQQRIQAEVNQLEVPPRPADWGGVKAPLSESDWSKEDLKNPQKKKEMTTLLQTQEQLLGVLLDNAWENHWRQEQVEALSKQKIESYLRAQEEEARNPRPSADPARNAEAGKPTPVSSSKQAKVSSQNADKKKRTADERKKKERQDKADRLTRQAAEREAALAKAKAAREQGHR